MFYGYARHVLGTVWWTSAGSDPGCATGSPHLVNFSSFCVIAFWVTTVVFAFYIFEEWYHENKKRRAEREKQRMEDLEKKIHQEEMNAANGIQGVADAQGPKRMLGQDWRTQVTQRGKQ